MPRAAKTKRCKHCLRLLRLRHVLGRLCWAHDRGSGALCSAAQARKAARRAADDPDWTELEYEEAEEDAEITQVRRDAERDAEFSRWGRTVEKK